MLQEGQFSRLSGGAVGAPSLATLRITYDIQGKAEAPMVKSQALQLTTEEARAMPNVVTGMNSHLFLISIIYDYAFFII